MASVIKAGRVIPSGTPVRQTEYNLQDMNQAASEHLETVKKKAARIVLKAQQEAQEILVKAEEKGRQNAEKAAREAALADVEARWKTLLPALRTAVASAAELKATWIGQWEQNIVRLVVAVAERVIREELGRQPRISKEWIREALELASGSTTITLHLNPDDHAALEDYRDVLKQQFSQLADADIVADPGISPGGCRVTTDHGYLDQQIETQLSRIEEELTA
ncbi:MAG: FliH/SctL family protein [Planctomycetota bacterium]